MKKIYILLLGIVLITLNAAGQLPGEIADFDIRIINDVINWPPNGYVVVQVRANNNPSLPHRNDIIDTLQFGIKWDKSTVNGNKLDFDFICADNGLYNPYYLTQDDSPIPHNVGGNGGWDCRNFELIRDQGDILIPKGWRVGVWEDIAILKVFRRTPGGQVTPFSEFYILQENDQEFIIDPPHKGFKPKFSFDGVSPSYIMNVPLGVGDDDWTSTTLDIPTATDGAFTWVGGRSNINPVEGYDDWSWNHGPNWDIGCGDGDDFHSEYPPGELDDCLIPSNCDYYPRYPSLNYATDIAKCNSLNVRTEVNPTDVAEIQWMQGVTTYNGDEVILNVYGDMNIDGVAASRVSIYKKGLLEVGNQYIVDTMTEGGGFVYKSDLKVDYSFLDIHSQGQVRVLYDTDIIGSNHGFNIFSGSNGPGNFKNFGDISYIDNGDASIQTFMKNTGEFEGDYYYHTVGPTVYNQDYHQWGGIGTGVALQNFDLALLETFAYQYNESASNWQNVWPYLYPIQTATGLLLSDTTGTDGYYTQTGEMLTGDVSIDINYPNNIKLVSNPYPCAINWNSLYNRNSDLVGPTIYIYNPSSGGNGSGWTDYNALTYQGSGASEVIQVGQGFFITTSSNTGEFLFTDADKVFSDTPLRSLAENRGSLKINIKGNGSSDDMVINFMDDATTGYDELYDTKDWGSYYEEATQIFSVIAGELLSVNSLPFYYDEMNNVPIQIECKAQDSYTLTFSNIETFNYTDIWLEDAYLEDDWVRITPENSTYLFFGSPELQSDRFIVHFNASYLPNAIDEVEESLINVYAANNELYIINNSQEEVKEIAVYNMLGQEVLRSSVVSQDMNQFELNVSTGYYAVRVLTDQNVYSEKVFIKAY